MVNDYAIARLQEALGHNDNFWDENNALFENNVTIYLNLKQRMQQNDLRNDIEFQNQFTRFYVLYHMPTVVRPFFYEFFEAHRNLINNMTARAITEELREPLGKNYFSYVTKMLNMINDEVYPIYDRNVERIFHRPCGLYGLDYKEIIYQDIADTYSDIIHSPLSIFIESFRQRFNANGIGNMKVLDAIFWVLGA